MIFNFIKRRTSIKKIKSVIQLYITVLVFSKYWYIEKLQTGKHFKEICGYFRIFIIIGSLENFVRMYKENITTFYSKISKNQYFLYILHKACRVHLINVLEDLRFSCNANFLKMSISYVKKSIGIFTNVKVIKHYKLNVTGKIY